MQPPGTPPAPTAPAGRPRLARVAALLAGLVGLLALLGWQLGIEALRSLGAGLTAMNPLTAVSFVAAGAALWLLDALPLDPPARVAAQALAAAVALAGALKLADYLFGLNLGLDQILYHGQLAAVGGATPNRMAPNTAFAFVLAGAGLLLAGWRRHWAAQWLALAGLVVALLALLGYSYGANEFYGLASYIPMALPTALGFCLVCLGLFALAPGQALAGTFTQPGPGGVLARRLLPAAIVVPFGLGWLALQGQARGLYGAPFGAALFTLATILILALAIWRTAAVLSRLDAARRQAEAELARERDLLHALMDNIPDNIYFKDAQSRFTLINPAQARFLGVSRPEDALGKTDADYQPGERGAAFLSEEAELLRTGQPLTDRLEYSPTPEGQPRWFSATKAPLRDEQGRIVGLVGISRDVTNRQQAEEAIQQLNRSLEQQATQLAFSNQELEAFAYSVSHDLRAPLRTVDGFSQALLEENEAQLTPTGQDYLHRIRAAAQRMSQLIEDLLDLSRMSRAELVLAPVNLSAVAENVAADLKARQPERAVTFTLQPGLTAQGDERLLRVALDNLLGNAWKFTARQPDARVEFGAVERDGEWAFFVRDNGAGFDMAYAKRLFGPFQRLHSVSEFPGTGIGLATVQRIVRRHGGRVWAEAAVGQGAAFFFTLPPRAPDPRLNPQPGPASK